jgi:hypothetical protein
MDDPQNGKSAPVTSGGAPVTSRRVPEQHEGINKQSNEIKDRAALKAKAEGWRELCEGCEAADDPNAFRKRLSAKRLAELDEAWEDEIRHGAPLYRRLEREEFDEAERANGEASVAAPPEPHVNGHAKQVGAILPQPIERYAESAEGPQPKPTVREPSLKECPREIRYLNQLIHDGVPPVAFELGHIIAQLARSKGFVSGYSLDTLTSMLNNKTSRKTVSRTLQLLKQRGHLEIQGGDGRGNTAVYRPIFQLGHARIVQ